MTTKQLYKNILIIGGKGSGKTTLANNIKKDFEEYNQIVNIYDESNNTTTIYDNINRMMKDDMINIITFWTSPHIVYLSTIHYIIFMDSQSIKDFCVRNNYDTYSCVAYSQERYGYLEYCKYHYVIYDVQDKSTTKHTTLIKYLKGSVESFEKVQEKPVFNIDTPLYTLGKSSISVGFNSMNTIDFGLNKNSSVTTNNTHFGITINDAIDDTVKDISEFPFYDMTNILIIGSGKSGKNTIAQKFKHYIADFSIERDYITYKKEKNVMITNELPTNVGILNTLSHIIMMDDTNVSRFMDVFDIVLPKYVIHLKTRYNFIVYDIKKKEFTMYNKVNILSMIPAQRAYTSKDGCILILTNNEFDYSDFVLKNKDVTFATKFPSKLSEINKYHNIIMTTPKYHSEFEKLFKKIDISDKPHNLNEALWYEVKTSSFYITYIKNKPFKKYVTDVISNSENTINLVIGNDNVVFDEVVFKPISFSKERYDNDQVYYNEFVKYTTLLPYQSDFHHTVIKVESIENIPKSFMSMFTMVYVEKEDEKCSFFMGEWNLFTYPLMYNLKTKMITK